MFSGGGQVQKQSFCGKLCNSLAGVVIGVLLVPCALALVWHTEQNAVCTAKAYSDARQQVTETPGGCAVDPSLNGRLV